ncbi:hypothetical protein DCAR_0728010 [Daucus carota subsp. sativus]|uniref:CASP-like protein n=1 Tax=Daucus carota subsp. sativus TaxID=79200 RepID=A0A164T680_DAUCS|nr:PREDICTED: CASP-like protein 5B3 [Daucus carota subsp. sativus]WOH08567.1 hypothetical protein DCAR_0728010 [Daucus carota subsp. sativus]
MMDFAGTPGTATAFVLRILQSFFAVASITFMVTTTSFYQVTAFCFLVASMGLQVLWSSGLAILDGYALATKKVIHNTGLVGLFVVGDWVTATLSLAAAASSSGITVLYFNDLAGCNFGEECQKLQLAAGLAFLTWITIGISSVIMLWILAAG